MTSLAKQTVVHFQDFRPRDVGERVSKALTTYARGADSLVRARPWQAVGVVALAGLAAGILVSLGTRGVRRRGRSATTTDIGAETEGG